MHIILDLIIILLNSIELGQYFKNPNLFFFRINDHHSNMNIGPISRLIFKYQELISKISKLFWTFINFIWEYFHHDI